MVEGFGESERKDTLSQSMSPNFLAQIQTPIPEHVRVVHGLPEVEGLHTELRGHIAGGLIILPVRLWTLVVQSEVFNIDNFIKSV